MAPQDKNPNEKPDQNPDDKPVLMWGSHLGLSSRFVIWVCHLGCYLGFSSGVVITKPDDINRWKTRLQYQMKTWMTTPDNNPEEKQDENPI
jgi:hypothetical protein